MNENKTSETTYPDAWGRRLTAEELTPTPEDRATGRRLVAEGYRQLSRKYRMVARLPESDLEPIELLAQLDSREAAHLRAMFNVQATECILRWHTSEEAGTCRTLSVREFIAFREAGGETPGGGWAPQAIEEQEDA